jgi:hypothetical protein
LKYFLEERKMIPVTTLQRANSFHEENKRIGMGNKQGVLSQVECESFAMELCLEVTIFPWRCIGSHCNNLEENALLSLLSQCHVYTNQRNLGATIEASHNAAENRQEGEYLPRAITEHDRQLEAKVFQVFEKIFPIHSLKN